MKFKNIWDLILDVSMGFKHDSEKAVTKKRQDISSFKSNLVQCQRFIDQEISLQADIPDGMTKYSDGAWIIDVFSADHSETITLKIPCDRSKPLELTETREVTKIVTTNYNTDIFYPDEN